MAEAAIPSPVEGDSEDVHWALTTAASLERRGEMQEALRWLRRAVAAALAVEHDGRAIELGKHAAAFETALVGAPTMQGGVVQVAPGGRNNKTLEVASKPIPLDGLDEPTHVDSARPPAPDAVTVVPFPRKATGFHDGTPWQEDTVISRGIVPPTHPNASTQQPATPRDSSVGSDTMDELPSYAPDPDGDTQAMTLEQGQELPASSGSATHVDSLRVAVLSAADGEPRLMALPGDAKPPDGSGVALLLPLSRQDAARIMQLLNQVRRRR